MLFAAAVSPTDPVAVLAMLKKLDVSLDTKVCIAGESLLNDGVGIVFFTTFLSLTRYQSFDLVHMLHFFLKISPYSRRQKMCKWFDRDQQEFIGMSSLFFLVGFW